MKKLPLLLVFLVFNSILISAQNYVLPLYNGTIPNSKNTGSSEKISKTDITIISDVQNPDISVYLPTKKFATGQAVIICPGGGYGILAYDLEGTDIASYLNSIGVAGIVLKYRLPTSGNTIEPHKAPLMDAQCAMRLVRFNAVRWNINPAKIGVMGFSAGGHLASTHTGSRDALLGKNADKDLLTYYSNELQVTKDTPPAFLVHADNDKGVPVENTLLMYKSLRANNVSAELHILSEGGHGFGLGVGNDHIASWAGSLKLWLKWLDKK